MADGNPAPPLSAKQSRLVARTAPEVAQIARRLVRRLHGIGLDELISVGNEALVLAATRYDPEHGVPFASYAHYRIRGAMIDAARRDCPGLRSNRRALRSLEATRATVRPDSVAVSAKAQSIEQRLKIAERLVERTAAAVMMAKASPAAPDSVEADEPSPERAVMDEQWHDRVRALLASLAADERRLVQAIYFEDASMQSYASSIGKHVSTVSRRHAKILDKLAAGLRRRDRGPSPSPLRDLHDDDSVE